MTHDAPPPIPDEPKSESKAIVLAANHAAKKAEVLAEHPDRAITLIDSAERKAERAGDAIKKAMLFIGTFIRMLRAYFSGAYPDLPWRTVVWGLAALLYFVWPIDLIPDILLVGFLDDAAVVMYVARQIQKDLDAFLAWETNRPAKRVND